MGKFIEEFYYGNLDPQARSTKQNKAVQKQMEVLMLNEDYLKQHHKATYNRLQTEGKLNSYLYEINAQAEEMFETLITKFKQSEGITEQFKASNQMEWVGRMNNISQRAAEVINSYIIYN